MESRALSNLAGRATNLILRESPGTSKILFRLLLVLVLLTAGFMVVMGATVMLSFPWDVPFMLDGGWRIMNGQIPHVDFYTPLGPVALLIWAFGMSLGGACVSSISYANAFLLVVLSVWAWTIARTRMSAALSFLFSLYVGFMVAATSNYGYDFKHLSYGAIYNRYGVALTALALIEALGCSRQKFPPWSYVLQGLSTGMALALVFFLKLSFFGVALLGLVAGAILVPQNRHRWVGLCAGALAISLLIFAYLRFDIAAFYCDMAMAGRARSVGLVRSAFGMVTDPAVFNSTFLMATLWCIAPCAEGHYRSWLPPRIGQGLLVLFLILAQAVLSLTNTQPPLATLFPVGSLLILEVARRAAQRLQATEAGIPIHHSTGWMATLLLALYFVAAILVPDMESLPYSAFIRFTEGLRITPDQKFAAAPMADMLVPHNPEYVHAVNDGCELLRRYSEPSDRIVTLDVFNPFSFAMQRPPPTGDALFWAIYNSFTRRVYLRPERVFEHAAIVMVPKRPMDEKPERLLMELYSNFLDAHYTLRAESAFWKLYRRRPN